MLTASEIKNVFYGRGFEKIVIDPWNEDQLNPNSYNLTISDSIKWYSGGREELDVMKQPESNEAVMPPEGFSLWPGLLYLGCTNEYTESHNLVPMINGRSSLARLGISVHQTGGFGDIGFCGNWTLEITCIKRVRIYPNIQIAQICWFRPTGKIDKRYEGKYQYSKSTTPVDSLLSTELNKKL